MSLTIQDLQADLARKPRSTRAMIVALPMGKGSDKTLYLEGAVEAPPGSSEDVWLETLRKGARQIIQTCGLVGAGTVIYRHNQTNELVYEPIEL